MIEVVNYTSQVEAYGRNGFIKQTGLELSGVQKYVNLFPINSRNQTSTAAMLQIPVSDLEAVITALIKVKNECAAYAP